MTIKIVKNKKIERDLISNIINTIKNKTKVKMNEVKKKGSIPVISQDKGFIAGYIDNKSVIEAVQKPVLLFGDHTTEVKYIDFNFCSGGDGTQIFRTNNRVLLRYLYFLLKKGIIKQNGYKRHFGDLKEKIICFPSINEQEKIVKELLKEDSRINKIKSLIEKIEIRNNYYADKLLSGELSIDENGKISYNKSLFENFKFEDLFIENKKSKLKAGDAKKIGLYKFFNCSTSQKLYSDTYNSEIESLFLSTGGSAAIHYCNEKAAYSTDVWAISSYNTKYMYYYYKSKINDIENCFQGAGLKHLSKKDFKNITISIPDEFTQNKIIKFLDNLENEKSKVEKLLKLEEKRFEWLSDKLLSGEYIIED